MTWKHSRWSRWQNGTKERKKGWMKCQWSWSKETKMKARSGLQLTLAILKPDLMTNPVRLQVWNYKLCVWNDILLIYKLLHCVLNENARILQNVKERILKEKFWIIRWKILQWQRKDAELFYQEHRGLSKSWDMC
jgi:hypothetical protein